MFLSTKSKTTDIAETLRAIDPIKSYAKMLREECCNLDFGLKNSYHSVEDIS